jgi:septum formation protein
MSNHFWMSQLPLILASKSQSRRALLTSADIPLEIVASIVDERAVENSLANAGGEKVSAALAAAKAIDVSHAHPDRIVLGADQTLSLGDKLLHKAQTAAQAKQQLTEMRAAVHQLNSAIAVATNGSIVFETVSVAKLAVRNFSDEFLDAYIESTGPGILSSVGCYQIEAQGIHLFEFIEGDQFTIMGLPLIPLLDYFRQAGLVRA